MNDFIHSNLKRISLLIAVLAPFLCAPSFAGQSDMQLAPEEIAECKIALRMVTSADFLTQNRQTLPELQGINQDDLAQTESQFLKAQIKTSNDPAQFCESIIRHNLNLKNAYHLPSVCDEFMPFLKKSFEERFGGKPNHVAIVNKKMADNIVDMLILSEIEPSHLIKRCEVGLKVMQVDLEDRHLREKYPLPASCELFFAEMEKAMILPSEFKTIQRQRVIFAIENKDDPERLVEICNEISK